MKFNKLLILGLVSLMMIACKRDGCTDQTASNYDSKANNDDGSCIYGDLSDPNNPNNPGQTLPVQITDSHSGTTVENLSSDPSVVDYYISGTWDVTEATVIEPGVRILMESGARITVSANGSLDATGTAAAPIEIFGEQAMQGYWTVIEINSNNLNNKFIYCSISDGGSSYGEDGIITLKGSAQAIIQNTSFSNGSLNGLALAGATCKIPNFKDNSFDGFAKEPIYIHSLAQAGFLDNTTSFSNNGTQKIKVGGENYSDNVTVTDIGIPYYIASSFIIEGGVTTLDQGVVLLMAANTNIEANTSGALKINGTVSNHVVITGDQPTKGFWQNIHLYANSYDNDFTYADISGGSTTYGEDATVFLKGNARLQLTNCSISNSVGAALNGDTGSTYIDGGGNSSSNCDGGPGIL